MASEGDSGEVIEVKSRKKEETSQKLADLAKQIRLSMDNEDDDSKMVNKTKNLIFEKLWRVIFFEWYWTFEAPKLQN